MFLLSAVIVLVAIGIGHYRGYKRGKREVVERMDGFLSLPVSVLEEVKSKTRKLLLESKLILGTAKEIKTSTAENLMELIKDHGKADYALGRSDVLEELAKGSISVLANNILKDIDRETLEKKVFEKSGARGVEKLKEIMEESNKND